MSIKPATILRLTLLGFILVAVPLTIGLLNTLWQVDHLAERMRQTVRDSTQAVESGRLITTLALSMERSALQYRVLRDTAILARYRDQRAPFIGEIQRLLNLSLDAGLAERLRQLREHEAALLRKLKRLADKADATDERLDEAEQLSALTASIPFDVTALVSRESERMNARIDAVRRLLIWQAIALIPLALSIAVIFSVLISRPLRRLGAAIRQLGGGGFDARIEVDGPRDIRELGEQLDWLRRELAALNEQKLQFLRHVSHELKTPLTTIREGAELLRDGIVGPLSEKQQAVARILHDDSLQLQAQVENLLNFNRALSRPSIEKRHVDIGALIETVVEKQCLALQARCLRVHVQMDARLSPLSVNGDAEQLRAIIDNLLSNAIKYSADGGGIVIHLFQRKRNLLLDVVDEGIGIDEEDRPLLFEPFFQGRAPSRGPLGGTGLGLSLVESYARFHGGFIELLDSDQGAHFRVTLPIKARTGNDT